ncbi:MAG: hypothetical protein HQL84_01155 [Magnetococcales bacterium]|nr:hypothetical protein [Magnetococcales bacterium]MBF0148636.1 hypothetical protein [Magnetococcales bacterium]MBF0172724.1 hypothetical protein [Magnetococcales bacterium]MBF0346863.1 hypothetical protein [Magnetococcales bacterium]MBF0630878.1 hypothetical protein [Magnetococcales bacterium]
MAAVPRRTFSLKTFLGILILLAATGAFPMPADSAEAETGNCAELDISRFKKDNKLQWSGIVRVLRQDAVVFADEQGTKRAGFLLFNQQAELLDGNERLFKIRTYRYKEQPETTGWVARKDLLCRNQPIKSETGLEMKFFIKTNTTARSEDQPSPDESTISTVQIFQDPELKDCVGGQGNCREGASRFHMYFVFDQTEESYLLADRFRLEEDDLLLGWVAKKDGFLWNNAFSIRPREDLLSPDGSGPGTVCTYEQLKDAVSRDKKACHPILGGREWFKSALRIPVLEMIDQNNRHISPEGVGAAGDQRRFFKVALARPGLVGRRISDDKVAISTGLASRIMPGFTSLTSKKHVDIFFLLDATASMEPFIDAVRGTPATPGVIQEIINKIKKSQGFKETEFRFGFRVYRDPYADREFTNGPGEGVGEGHPLPSQCDLNDSQQQVAFESFQKSISQVRVSGNDIEDDYQENLFGGLNQVLSQDLQPCPDNLKILFVIGDNGYQTSRPATGNFGQIFQKAKYANPISRKTLLSLMQRGNKGLGDNLISFFIQTPSHAEQVRHPESYRKAYAEFESQSKDLLSQSLPADSKLDDHFLRMGEEGLVQRMVGTVEKLGSSALIDEIILDIRGGGALVNIIDRLRRERVDIPGVYWHILKQGACGELGKQCEHRIYDTTRIGYIEADEKVVEELWVTSSALSSWIRILRGFEGYFDLPEGQLRRALVNTLIVGLQQEIRKPPIDTSGETPAQYAQRRGGLPVRNHSPLLSYNVNSLLSEKIARDRDGHLVVVGPDGSPLLDRAGIPIPAVPVCELRRLAAWAIRSKEMLEIVEKDFNKPVFKIEPYRPHLCPDSTENGRMIGKIDGLIRAEPLGEDKNYRFAHIFGGSRGYWIPQEYLP